MDEETRLIVIIFLMALVTFIPRVVPLQIHQKHWPKWLKNSLEFLPVAIVASITVPNIITNSYEFYFITAEFIASIFAIIIAFYSKNLIITILAALLIFFILEKYLII
jgi:branched-subunit amino acid transport protein